MDVTRIAQGLESVDALSRLSEINHRIVLQQACQTAANGDLARFAYERVVREELAEALDIIRDHPDEAWSAQAGNAPRLILSLLG